MSEGAAERAGSTTATTTTVEPATAIALRLRAPRRVRFNESAVDNEGLGRKKSKSCCVFHRRRQFDESSSESADECGECAPAAGQ
ncbi:phosphatase inhibitor-domain-containing protein [Pavlovales sp. CCMP2436]|nr:phosphatase inhibitor-domain-containing protein [Pavlovales sp. CCMP2436]